MLSFANSMQVSEQGCDGEGGMKVDGTQGGMKVGGTEGGDTSGGDRIDATEDDDDCQRTAKIDMLNETRAMQQMHPEFILCHLMVQSQNLSCFIGLLQDSDFMSYYYYTQFFFNSKQYRSKTLEKNNETQKYKILIFGLLQFLAVWDFVTV